MRVNSKKTIQSLARALGRAFKFADCPEDIEPVFREAAEGEGEGGGVKWHGMGGVGVPEAKYHAMTGQAEATQDVRRSRMDAKNYRNKVIGRAEYYDSFEKYNTLEV